MSVIQKLKRVPIVTILGHVDHGKTTILDKIRSTSVQLGEVGGITQKISAFTVNIGNDRKITFIDTPGHEAFDLMRSRGGTIADIVLLIVAADDSVQPQTKESIEIIKKSNAKPIVVINKIDLPDVDIEKVKREVTNQGLQVEGLGGNIPVVLVSGKTGKGLDQLLETIFTVAEVEGLSEHPALPKGAKGRGFVLETIKDQSKGYVATVVNVQGEFHKADWFAFRNEKNEVTVEKIKGFISEEGENIDEFKEGCGGKILGLSSLVALGTEVFIVEQNDKKLLSTLFESLDEARIQEETTDDITSSSNEDLLTALFDSVQKSEDEKKKLNVIIKSSSEGSLEAIKKSLERIDVEGHKVHFVSSSIGDANANDVDTASATKSIILAFEVSASAQVIGMAREKKVLLRTYNIIYKIVEEVTDALTLMATPRETEEDLGEAEVKMIFTLTDGTKVIGGRVKKGIIKRNEKCYIVRKDEIVGEGKITSVRTGKTEINEAQKNMDFGIVIDQEVDAQEGDTINCFKVVKVTF